MGGGLSSGRSILVAVQLACNYCMLNTKDIADLQFQSNQLGDPIKDL